MKGDLGPFRRYEDVVAEEAETAHVDSRLNRTESFSDMADERRRAHLKHVAKGGSRETVGPRDALWLAVLVEEVGEVARAQCDRDSLAHLREELIQVGAMVSAWVDSIDIHVDTFFSPDVRAGALGEACRLRKGVTL